MAKPKPIKVKSPSSVKKVTIRMPQFMRDDVHRKMIEEGYNLRQKSKWVAEAVEYLIGPSEWEGVLLSQADVEADTQDVITLPVDLHERLSLEMRRLLSSKPFLNPSLSSIIRAAIQRRCMGIHRMGQ